jgi:hypothetical protein
MRGVMWIIVGFQKFFMGLDVFMGSKLPGFRGMRQVACCSSPTCAGVARLHSLLRLQ